VAQEVSEQAAGRQRAGGTGRGGGGGLIAAEPTGQWHGVGAGAVRCVAALMGGAHRSTTQKGEARCGMGKTARWALVVRTIVYPQTRVHENGGLPAEL
jgi:hypothetical protein